MKLYRLATAEEDEAARYQGDPYREVEACEHGKFDRHCLNPERLFPAPDWCDGAGLEDSE